MVREPGPAPISPSLAYPAGRPRSERLRQTGTPTARSSRVFQGPAESAHASGRPGRRCRPVYRSPARQGQPLDGFGSGRRATGPNPRSELAEISAKAEGELRERLARFGEPDKTTGFQHFEFFQRLLLMELKRAKRYGYSLAAALIAVDDPDVRAHPRRQLAACASGSPSAITSNIRDIDYPVEHVDGRVLVFLPYTDLEGATEVGNRVVKAVRKLGPPRERRRRDPRHHLGGDLGPARGPAHQLRAADARRQPGAPRGRAQGRQPGDRQTMTITARTRLAAVLGAPVEHSMSPALHNAAFAAAGIDAVYVALEVATAGLPAVVRALSATGAVGASVTVPHKRAVLELCDRVDELAERIGAVNCLVFDGGDVIGHNTDAAGFTDALIEARGEHPDGWRPLLLGGGGAARAVAAGLEALTGARPPVIARSPRRVEWTRAVRLTTQRPTERFGPTRRR